MKLKNKSFKIIIAHPDDEILFFNSIITSANRIVICYGPSNSEVVTTGRETLKLSYPFGNVKFLDIPESNVYDSLTFKNRRIIREGVSVHKDSISYASKFDILREQLRFELVKGDTVFTHNPWGEYGHPEHVQVFSAVSSLIDEFNLEVFVNGYVSDKTFEFMSKRYSLLSSESFVAQPNDELGQKVKKIYRTNNCWTWSNGYQWPSTEIFYRLLSNDEKSFSNHDKLSYPPLNVLAGKFTGSFLRYQILRFIPLKVKLILKRLLNIK